MTGFEKLFTTNYPGGFHGHPQTENQIRTFLYTRNTFLKNHLHFSFFFKISKQLMIVHICVYTCTCVKTTTPAIFTDYLLPPSH